MIQTVHMDHLERFYTNNAHDPPKKLGRDDDSIFVISYNVHGWKNYNPKISIYDNYTSIKKMISSYNLDIVALQHVEVDNKLTLDKIIDDFKKDGYNYYARCPDRDGHMITFSKHRIKIAKCMNIKIHKTDRTCMCIRIKGFTFVVVHLDVGERPHHLDPNDIKRKEMEYNNELRRKWQLQRIFNAFGYMDAIIGDFNFAINTPEFQMMLTEKQFTWDGINNDTTPYNRTDYMFLNSKSKYKIINSRIIRCNYSDHLPIVTEFNKNG